MQPGKFQDIKLWFYVEFQDTELCCHVEIYGTKFWYYSETPKVVGIEEEEMVANPNWWREISYSE